MSKSNLPELRLDGFEGEWNREALGNLAAVSSAARVHRNDWRKSGIPFFRTSDVTAMASGKKNERVYIDPALYQELTARSGKLAAGDILVVGGGSIGTPYIVPDNSPLYSKDADLLWVKPQPALDSYFFTSFLATSVFTSYLKSISHIGTISHYTIEQAKVTPVPLPPTVEEQQAIGSTFSSIDATLTSHKKKLDLLKQTKTSLLQRMFPADGATVPELRLEGFSDSWKEESLADIATYSKGKGYSKADMTEEGTPLFHYGRLYTKYELAVTDVDTFSQVRADSILSRGDEVLVPASGETAEDIATASALLQPGVLLGGDLNVIRPRPGFDSVFLALSLSHGESKAALASRAQGKSVVHVHNPDIQSLVVLFPPTLAEQRAIGAVFAKLDTLISAEAQYIDKLTQTKTALLQKMFV